MKTSLKNGTIPPVVGNSYAAVKCAVVYWLSLLHNFFLKKVDLRFCTGSYPVFVGRFSTVRTSNNGAGWKYDLKQIVRYQSKLYGHLKFKRFMMSKIL